MTIKEMETKARELRELKRFADQIQDEIDTLQDALKAAMGDQEQVVCGEYKITYKPMESARIDTKALKKALPEVAEQFTKITATKRFSVN